MFLKTSIFTFYLTTFFAFTSFANIVSVDVQNFSSISSGLDFVTVHSSETLRPCYINCGFFLNYGSNTLPDFADSNEDFKDQLLFSDINFGLGLTKNWDLGISLAQVHFQSISNEFVGTKYEKTGFTDIRINTKYRFFGNQRGGLATVLSTSINQIKNNPFVGEGAGPTFNFELVGDMTLKNRLAIAGNIGYRLRKPGKQSGNGVIQPIGNQFIASAAMSYHIPEWDTKIIGEIFSGFLDKESQNNKATLLNKLDVVELLVGFKHDFSNSISGHFGTAFGLLSDSSSADWRVYTGINFNLGPYGPCKEQNQARIVRLREGQTPAESMMSGEEEDFSEAPQSGLETFLANVLFNFDKDILRPDGLQMVQRLADYLLSYSHKFVSLNIEGHTDSIGDGLYNIDLSQRRSKNVAVQLIKLGLPKSKVYSKGFGSTEPIADNGNYQGRALNRRVEFKVEWKK